MWRFIKVKNSDILDIAEKPDAHIKKDCANHLDGTLTRTALNRKNLISEEVLREFRKKIRS